VWDTCEGERCDDHDELSLSASKQYRCYKDSEETKREVADTWVRAAPQALDQDLANRIRQVEQEGKVKVRVEPTEPAHRNPTRFERPDYREEEKKSKANKLLLQVGSCLILSILPFLF
jgi:hypothetical protein